MNDVYEQKRQDLLLKQTAERLETDEAFKRHTEYVGRLKGRDPGKGTELLKVLTVVRSRGVCSTSDVCIARMKYTHEVVAKLKHLQERGLVARQQRLSGFGTGFYESTWSPEKTAEWPPKKIKK